MGLYDENESDDQGNAEEIGKAVAKANRKPKKGSAIASNFEIPELWKNIAIYALIVIFLGVIIYGLYLTLQPNMISYSIKPNPIYASDETVSQLKIEIENVNDYTLKNTRISVKPVDNVSVVVIPSDDIIIPILGPNEKRSFTYSVEGIGEIPAGEYTIVITSRTPAETYTKNVVWKVKRQG